jgi:hypothetical protein
VIFYLVNPSHFSISHVVVLLVREFLNSNTIVRVSSRREEQANTLTLAIFLLHFIDDQSYYTLYIFVIYNSPCILKFLFHKSYNYITITCSFCFYYNQNVIVYINILCIRSIFCFFINIYCDMYVIIYCSSE